FGTTIATARAATAVIHGLTIIALYGACRRLGVRPWLAAAAGCLHLIVDQAAWPIASQHWLSTLLCTLLLWTFAGGVETSTRAAGGGVLLGLLALVQQQRALPMAVGTAAWLVVDRLLARAYGRRIEWSAAAARVAALGGAVAIVTVPVLVLLVVRAGL